MMRTVKKVISIILIMTIMAATFCSCDLIFGSKTAEEVISAADAVLAEKPHAITTAIVYSSDNEELNETIAKIKTPLIKTEVNGEAFRMSVTFVDPQKPDDITDTEAAVYTYVDGTLYTQITENGKVTNTTTEITDKNKDDIVSGGITVGVDDFDNVDCKTISKASVVTCSGIKSEPLDKLIADLENTLPIEDSVVAIKDGVLIITTAEDAYVSMIFTCSYVITTPTATYTVVMACTSIYEYDQEFEIGAPDFD